MSTTLVHSNSFGLGDGEHTRDRDVENAELVALSLVILEAGGLPLRMAVNWTDSRIEVGERECETR